MKIKAILLSAVILSSFILSSVLPAAMAVTAVTDTPVFFDLDFDYKYYKAVEFIKENKIVNGYPDGTYRPANVLNRAELLKIIVEAVYEDEFAEYADENCFKDVPAGEWYTQYVCFAKDHGFVVGYQGNVFKPEEPINLVEAVKISMEVFGYEYPETDPWYKGFIEEAAKGKFIPLDFVSFGQDMNRGQMADLITRILKSESEVLDEYLGDNANYAVTYETLNDNVNVKSDAVIDNESPSEVDDLEVSPLDLAVQLNWSAATDNKGVSGYQVHYGTSPVTKPEEVYEHSVDVGNVLSYKLPGLTNGVTYYFSVVAYDSAGNESSSWAFEVSSAPTADSVDIVDVSDDSSEDSDVNISVSLNSDQVNVGDTVNLDITITDKDDNPLEDRIVSANATAPIDFSESLFVAEVGNGLYRASFSSTLAGDFSLAVNDKGTSTEVTETVSFEPSYFDHVEVIDVVYPHENDEHNKATIKVTGKDEYENTLPYSSVNNNLGAISTLGSVSVSHDDGGIFTIDVTANDFGTAYVSIIDKGSSTVVYDENIEIVFLPVQLGITRGIDLSDGQIAVPIYVYLPDDYGRLGGYEFDIYYDTNLFDYVDIEDPYPSDNFATPLVEVSEESGFIHLYQTNSDPNATAPEDIAVGAVLFNVSTVGSGTIYVSDATLTDTSGAVIEYSSKFSDYVGGAIDVIGGVSGDVADAVGGAMGDALDGAFRWWYNIKETIDVCIDAFVFAGSGATAADITADITMANFIFGKIAQSCNCDFYLNIKLNSTTNLTAAQWNAVDANGDEDLDFNAAELNAAANNHPPSGSCMAVYYVPDLNGTTIGVSWEGPSEGIAIDSAADAGKNNRALAHELAHQISNGAVVDPNNPPTSATQGADTAGNLMNYTNTGDDLTKDQCKLIEDNL